MPQTKSHEVHGTGVRGEAAAALFLTVAGRAFPSCTQVTLSHGICDSQCLSCPIGRVRHGDATEEVLREFRPGTRVFMSFEVFARVADEVAQHPEAWLRMHARGEPLLHPRFVDMVRYAKEARVSVVQSFTDAISLEENRAREILEAGLDVLECSIHGHHRSYEKLMRNGRFEQVRANVIRFRELRDALGAPTRLVVSAVDQPEFRPEKADHRRFWQDYADEVIYRPHHSWGNRIDGACASLPATRAPCAQLWTRLTVGPTGNVLACFNSWSEAPEEVLGNVLDPHTTLASIWRSSAYSAIRSGQLEGNYILPCCRSCKDWGGSSWGDDSYENLIDQKLGLRR